MSKMIRDISKDIKCKIRQSDTDIRKAIDYKAQYPILAENYYNFSINEINEILDLHNVITRLIQESKEEPPKVMLEMWDWVHQELLNDIENIKILQKFYKDL